MSVRHAMPALLLVAALTAGAQGQAVQLPSFRVFTVPTTVLVPDRGSAFNGGIYRSSMGRNQSGVPGLGGLPYAGRLFNNVGIGRNDSASTVHTSAYIIDHDEMDRALLAEAARRRGASVDIFGRPVEPLAGDQASGGPAAPAHRIVQNESSDRGAQVAQARSTVVDPSAPREHRGSVYLQRGLAAEGEGKAGVAKIYFQMAAKRGDQSVRQQAAARLAGLNAAARLPAFATNE